MKPKFKIGDRVKSRNVRGLDKINGVVIRVIVKTLYYTYRIKPDMPQLSQYGFEIQPPCYPEDQIEYE